MYVVAQLVSFLCRIRFEKLIYYTKARMYTVYYFEVPSSNSEALSYCKHISTRSDNIQLRFARRSSSFRSSACFVQAAPGVAARNACIWNDRASRVRELAKRKEKGRKREKERCARDAERWRRRRRQRGRRRRRLERTTYV